MSTHWFSMVAYAVVFTPYSLVRSRTYRVILYISFISNLTRSEHIMFTIFTSWAYPEYTNDEGQHFKLFISSFIAEIELLCAVSINIMVSKHMFYFKTWQTFTNSNNNVTSWVSLYYRWWLCNPVNKGFVLQRIKGRLNELYNNGWYRKTFQCKASQKCF